MIEIILFFENEGAYIQLVTVETRELLRLSGVSFGYKPDYLLFHDFSLAMAQGESVIISGQIGSGKTTLVNLIIGRLKPYFGDLFIQGRSMDKLSGSDHAKLLAGWGMILEDNTLLFDRSVWENITTSIRLSATRIRPQRRDIDSLLRLFGLVEKRKRNPATLSKGEQKLVQLIMACVRNPTLLIWDNPDDALDKPAFLKAMDIVRRKHLTGTSVIIATSRPQDYSYLQWRNINIESKGR